MRRASRSVPFNIGKGVGKRGRARAAAYEVALDEAKEPCRGPWAVGRGPWAVTVTVTGAKFLVKAYARGPPARARPVPGARKNADLVHIGRRNGV
ncbi:MAG: hypothetical protein HY744_27160 [Deltaproteobacteria bacterium]|nr:hypothetical protein [Deltaproteobacteria bacterium]